MSISELKKKAVARQFLAIDAYYGKVSVSAAMSVCVAIYISTYTIHTHTHIYVRV